MMFATAVRCTKVACGGCGAVLAQPVWGKMHLLATSADYNVQASRSLSDIDACFVSATGVVVVDCHGSSTV